MRRRTRRGSVIVEAAMMIPLLLYFFLGLVEFARVGYTYFTAQKMLYTFARFVGTQQGVNLCDASEITILQAKNLALTGTTDSSLEPIIPGLTPDSIQLRVERVDPASGEVAECACSAEGCDASQGGRPPDFITARFTDGVSVQLRIPLIPTDPIQLRPQVRVPYGGT
ncbi:MAG: pilus assembly protein [Bryobacteraceae bacterium]|nr:pilus assembly protein [Bryobacteraceae bacterium]